MSKGALVRKEIQFVKLLFFNNLSFDAQHCFFSSSNTDEFEKLFLIIEHLICSVQ